ncbi:MerR family transcriptional regulator [Allokutzneria albata]|uniref:DNA-binding transcriptional regulator, MerR family n=1 Tax=Allokutzneria albata TaxID=211114 RepID=A0A1G9U334_ALLAB|nr:MerR family transcriptional regulator [Allokutzneria albata]SDM54450.1 DNA-binding transcriptional regulator, MerR family [Allokutzneria albata]
MLTISQLAAHVGCTTKAVRVYHQRGLLPEPERDASGYRRYDAQAVIDLARIVTLAKSGVPLSRIPDVLHARPGEIERIDSELRDRIRELQDRRRQLRQLDQPDRLCLPPEAVEHMERFRALGLSERHERAVRDGWILICALAPGFARAYLPVRTALLEDEEYVAVMRSYDEAIDWEPDDPRLDAIADAAFRLARRMTLPSDLPSWKEVPREAVEVVIGHNGIDSPAWRRLDEIVEQRLARVV